MLALIFINPEFLNFRPDEQHLYQHFYRLNVFKRLVTFVRSTYDTHVSYDYSAY